MTNKRIWTLRELHMISEFGIGSVDGEFTFQGTGNYGRGGPRQLAGGLNQATQALQDQEQAELNQNVEDQAKTLRKFKRKVEPFKLPDLKSNDKVDMTGSWNEQTLVGSRALPGDHFYRDLPGYPEKVNALEKHVDHVPSYDKELEIQDYYKDQEEIYFDNVDLKELEEMVVEALTSLNSGYWLVRPKDHLYGNPVNDNTQSNITSRTTNLASPKNFVPEDWSYEQEHMYDDEDFWGFQPDPKEKRHERKQQP